MKRKKPKTKTLVVTEKTHGSLVRHCVSSGMKVQVVADSAIRIYLNEFKNGAQ